MFVKVELVKLSVGADASLILNILFCVNSLFEVGLSGS